MCLASPCAAQEATAGAGAFGATARDQAASADAATAPRALKMTPVALELVDPVGSKTSKSLETFRVVLAEPVMVDEFEVIPAGTPGTGEIVHAKKAGGMGAAGELVVAARFLDLGDRKVRLRSTVIDAEGKSRINGVSNLAAASAASPLPVAWIGFFIKGGEIELPPGTRLVAKLAEDFSPAAPAIPAAASEDGNSEAVGTAAGNWEGKS
ncbi:hypothetical protein N0B51_05075 [Tsuneonella sp. YG55]|uniref:Uncharacterized protein n=1 Tax=Tsuneonella litorea TaxID=2976475 RepID=A0A9X3AMF6_9SPHN|nr:hypothetical protein [Tsuneonella litorea]MCT2558347.1 hypothetical protein [Tsuneonella litorea]